VETGDPVEHLFRRESGRMVAALTRVFGFHNLALAEDVVQDALCARSRCETPRHAGQPVRLAHDDCKEPGSRCFAAGADGSHLRARNHPAARIGVDFPSTIEAAFGPHAIQDDELRMMFSCIDPRLTGEAQVALILHILCGFQCR